MTNLRGVPQSPPPENTITHCASHVITATILDNSCTAMWTATVLDPIDALGKERVLHPVPQAPTEPIVLIFPLVLAKKTHYALLTPIADTHARHLWTLDPLRALGAARAGP